MRGLTSTLALTIVLAGLAGYIYFVDAGGPVADEARETLFAVEADRIGTIRLTAGGETSVLEKTDDTWKMTAPVATGADTTEVSSLTTNLASLAVNRVVDENAADLAEYGLAEPRITVAYTAGDQSGTVALGDTSATGSDVYARVGDTHKVVLLSSFIETTFDKSPFDLRDKRVLAFERDKADGLTIDASGAEIRMTRDGSAWTVEAPVTARGDYGAIEGLLTRLSTTSMTSLVDAAASGGSGDAYGLAAPVATITVSSGSSQAVLAVGTETDGKTYARDRSRDLLFTIDPSIVTDLTRDVSAYRDKDVFEFRPFNAEQVAVTRNGDTVTLRKTPADGQGSAESWTLERNGAATALDQARAEDLLTKLANIRAEAFAGTTAGTGLDAPDLTVAVSYDGGKFERVRIARHEGSGFGSREGEPGAARVPIAAVDDAITALDAALSPPPAEPAATRP
jgi:hypothetical protein